MSYDRFKAQREGWEKTQQLVEDEFERRNLDEWGYPKKEPVRQLTPQEIVAERNRQQAEKWNNANSLWQGLKNMNLDDWLDVGGQSLQGAERVLSGATFGGYDWLNRKLGGNYEERKQRLQQAADDAGIGLVNSLTGAGLEIAGNMVGGGSVLSGGLAKAGLKGVAQSSVGGGIEGMINSAFATENPEDLLVNMVNGGVEGLISGYGFGKALQAGGRYLRPIVTKYSPKLQNITKMRRGPTGEAGVDLAMQEARNLQQSGMLPKNYRDDVASFKRRANLKTKPMLDELGKVGDMEVYEISGHFNKIPGTPRVPYKVRNESVYGEILNEEARKINKTLYSDGTSKVNHFMKDEGRKGMLNTLSNTYTKPDVAAWKFTQQRPTKYFMTKYHNQGSKRDMYDLVIQRKDGEIFNKFATPNSRYIANEFRHPVNDLQVSNRFMQSTGINPQAVKDGYLSEIAHMADKNAAVQKAIEISKGSDKHLRDLSNTDFMVLDRTRKVLEGSGAKKAASKLQGLMDRSVPQYANYRQGWNQAYNQEMANMLSHQDLNSFQRYLDFSRGIVDPLFPMAVSGQIGRYQGE